MTTIDHPPVSSIITSGRWAFGLHERGAGRPVVLLHGLLTDSRVWEALAASLAPAHRVIAIDAPGHGASPRQDTPFTLESLVDALATVLADRIGDEPAVWIGHSMGGMKALRAALLRPELVAGLVLVSTQPYPEPASTAGPYEAMVELAIAEGISPDLAQLIGRLNFHRDYLGSPEAAQWIRHFTTLNGDDIAETCYAVYRRKDISDRLHQIPVPALVVHGAADVPIRPKIAQRYAAQLPRARLQILPDTGHTPPCERPTELSSLVREFLAGSVVGKWA